MSNAIHSASPQREATGNRASLWFIGLVVAVVVIAGNTHMAQQLENQSAEDMYSRAAVQFHETNVRLEREIAAHRASVHFLSQLPPIQGIVRAMPANGRDPLDGTALASWKKRLAEIYAGYLESHPQYLQARFIGLADGGREIVRVEREKGLVVATPEANLQRKARYAYVADSVNQIPGVVRLSEINLNKENGVISMPPQPTLRLTLRIDDASEEPFGVMVLNCDARALLERSFETERGWESWIVNDEGDFLHHPDSNRSFGRELNQEAHRWAREFTPVAVAPALAERGAERWRAADGREWITFRREFPIKEIHQPLQIILGYDATLLDMETRQQQQSIGLRVIAILLVLVVALVGFAWYRRNLAAIRSKALAEALEQRVRERTDELDQNRRFLDTILDALPVLVGYWGADGINRYANKTYHEWFGKPPRSIPGLRLAELLPPERLSRIQPLIDKALSGTPSQVELELPWPDGRGSQFVISTYLPDTHEGVVQGFFVITIDTTALMTERHRLENVIEGANAGTWEWNVQTGEVRFNKRWAEIVGYTLDELQPVSIKTWEHFAHPDDFLVSAAQLAEHFAGKTDFYVCDIRVRHRDGHWRWVTDRGRVVTRTEAGEPLMMYGTHIDVTDLVLARERAEAASRAKSRLLATMSHELRTPLNGILGVAQVLAMPGLDENERAESVQTIQTSGKRLMDLLGTILDYTQIESGDVVLHPYPASPVEMLTFAIRDFETIATEKGLALATASGLAAEAIYELDMSRVRLMLTQLMSNAVKFTAAGTIRLDVDETDRDGEWATLRFSVTDTGVGVAAEHLENIFNPFEVGDDSLSRQFDGVGVGLAIVRALARRMGGDAYVSSTLGEGSRFWFDIRVQPFG